MEAALDASREIGFTIISMTISLVAVFIPVLFMGGIVGRLLHEFSVTIVVAILISGFVSLTSDADARQPLPRTDHQARHGLVYRVLEGGFDAMHAVRTKSTLGIAMRFRLATLMVAVAACWSGTVYLFMTMPTGFIPSQDSGFMFAVTHGPAGCLVRLDGAASHARSPRSFARTPT